MAARQTKPASAWGRIGTRNMCHKLAVSVKPSLSHCLHLCVRNLDSGVAFHYPSPYYHTLCVVLVVPTCFLARRSPDPQPLPRVLALFAFALGGRGACIYFLQGVQGKENTLKQRNPVGVSQKNF